MSYQSGINQYKQVNVQSMRTAAPQEIVRMLLAGTVDKLSAAKGAIERNNFIEQQKNIRGARQIIDALKASLNMSEGGEISQNLDDLYDYMNRRLFDANKNKDVLILEEVSSLLCELKSGWDEVCIQHKGGEELQETGVVLGSA